MIPRLTLEQKRIIKLLQRQIKINKSNVTKAMYWYCTPLMGTVPVNIRTISRLEKLGLVTVGDRQVNLTEQGKNITINN